MNADVFGFSTEPSSSADFTPIIKYDARSGRIFRIDRVDTGNGFENNPEDITPVFKAIMDLENMEVGWMLFAAQQAPSLVMMPIADLRTKPMPSQPSEKHKNEVRILLKLAKPCAGEKSIREIAGIAKSFLSGVEALYKDYLSGKAANPGKLPVVVLDGSPRPVKTGSGAQTSTNYKPVFKIDGWSKRPDDLVYLRASEAIVEPLKETPPETGSSKPQPKSQAQAPFETEDDFG